MSLLKLRSAPFVLIEDDVSKNTIPLLLEVTQGEKGILQFFSYEQSITNWKRVFSNRKDVKFHEEFNPDQYELYTNEKSTIVIDSLNQMVLCLGWSNFLKQLQRLRRNHNIVQIIAVLHKDCLSHTSKLHHMSHLASAIVAYDTKECNKVAITLKKGGKVHISEEVLIYDEQTRVLKSLPVQNEGKRVMEAPQQPSPGSLSTFKIEVDQIDKMEKSKLQLPYMSKINHGDSKVFYEPDAVDDWDEEDPDEDLDI